MYIPVFMAWQKTSPVGKLLSYNCSQNVFFSHTFSVFVFGTENVKRYFLFERHLYTLEFKKYRMKLNKDFQKLWERQEVFQWAPLLQWLEKCYQFVCPYVYLYFCPQIFTMCVTSDLNKLQVFIFRQDILGQPLSYRR